jgi:hypothetical protein
MSDDEEPSRFEVPGTVGDGAAGPQAGPAPPPLLALTGPAKRLRAVRRGRSPTKHSKGTPPRPPWSPGLLDAGEGDWAAQLTHRWVVHYNTTLATGAEEVIPPCWPAHPGLAAELSVWAWCWHDAHVTATDPSKAADFYTRHLPAFRDRIKAYLGANPPACRAGQHPQNWHRHVDEATATFPEAPDPHQAKTLGVFDYGFTPAPGNAEQDEPEGDEQTQ